MAVRMGRIIGLSGKIGTGKSTLADLLSRHLPGWLRMSFAGVLKAECAHVFGYPEEWGYSEDGKAMEISAPHDLLPWLGTDKGVITVREALQLYGDFQRSHEPDYFVTRLAQAVDSLPDDCPGVLVDDVRFPNEAEMVRERGMLVRVMVYQGWQPGAHAGHRSETALDDYPDFHVIVHPCFGQLAQAADEILAAWSTGGSGDLSLGDELSLGCWR